MSDRITLTGLTGFGYHGVYEAEKREGQLFVADVVLHLDLLPAGTSDDLAQTVNYADLSTRIVETVESGSCDLIETVAQKVADVCLADNRVDSVEVTIHKPQVKLAVQFSDVAVTIHRSRPCR